MRLMATKHTLKCLLFSVLLCGYSAFAQTKNELKLYIEPKVGQTENANCYAAYPNSAACHGRTEYRDYTLKATDALMSTCPTFLTVTTDRDSADYTLRLQTGASVLFNKAGDAIFVSHEKRKLSRFAMDICTYIAKH
jgi:hypothetical protein